MPARPSAPAPLGAQAAQPDEHPAEQGPGFAIVESVPTIEALAPLRFGTAVLLATGLLGVVEARRRRRLRSAPAHVRLPLPDRALIHMEAELHRLSRPELLARVDLAVRGAAAALAGRAAVLAVVAGDDGSLQLVLSGPVAAHEPFEGQGDRWRLRAATPTETVPIGERFAAFPSPALAHIGRSASGEVFVDLEGVGLLVIAGEGTRSTDVLRAITAALAVSPFGEPGHLLAVGIAGLERLTEPGALDRIITVGDADAAIDLAAGALGPVLGVLRPGDTTFALRARSTGEMWEPAVVALGAESVVPAFGDELRALATPPGRGLALLTDADLAEAPWRLAERGATWVLEPLGLELEPTGLSPADAVIVGDLLRHIDTAELTPVPAPSAHQGTTSATPATAPPFTEPPWQLLVRVLGPIDVVDRSGSAVAFERSKALELVAWLAEHRRQPTRSAARAALWDVDVRDATFANVVSDARRSLARLVTPPEGSEWIGRTLTDHLPLHELVRTDADLLAARLAAARSAPDPDSAISLLRPGLELVRSVPFDGAPWLWADAEGCASNLVLLVTSAAVELAERCLAVDDTAGVFWATGRGLLVLPGHEELIAIRMRAHARSGDLAGVRAEWEAYERVLDADPWGDGEPSAKLAALRRELLTAPTADPQRTARAVADA